MIPLLWRANFNYLRRHPWQLILSGVSIALGVAVVIAVHVMQASAHASMTAAQRALSGLATDQVVPQQDDLDEALYRTLSMRFPDLIAHPVLEGELELARTPGEWLHLVGLDLLSAARNPTASALARPTAEALLSSTPTALVSAQTLRQLPTTRAQRYPVRVGATEVLLRLISTPALLDTAPLGTAIVDIATAQELLQRPHRLSRIDLTLPRGAAGRTLRATLAAALPPSTELRDVALAHSEQRNLTRAFDLNLTALSLLALLVGMFLIHNTETFLIVQRRLYFARLRALGVTRNEIFRAVLVEAGAIGGVASGAGVLLGLLLAQGLLQLVSQTINDLYYAVSIPTISVSLRELLLIGIGGVAATMCAAVPAAIEATHSAQLHRATREHQTSRRVLAGAGACIVAAYAGLQLGANSVWRDFAVLSLGLAAIALVVPLLVWPIARGTVAALRGRTQLITQLGFLSVARHRQRAGVAAAALSLAAAVSLGMQLMTGSFRDAVEAWLEHLLRADVYISLVGAGSLEPLEARLLALRRTLLTRPEIAAISAVSRRVVHAGHPITLMAYDLPLAARAGFDFVSGDPQNIWSRWDAADTAIISEPYALRHQLHVEQSIWLPTPVGNKSFLITGIYRDYASEQGLVAISQTRFHQYWRQRGYRALGIYFKPGANRSEIIAQIRRDLGPTPTLRVALNAEIKARSLEVFDRTFKITQLLGVLAMAVSLAGIVGALLAQQLERARDYGVLRALGVRDSELAVVIMSQTLFIASLAALVALPVGIGVAAYLVQVVNVHSFGWIMPLKISSTALITTTFEVIAAAALAGIYPTLRAMRIPPARALHYE